MGFSVIATVAAVAALLLGFGWLFAGPLLLKRWRMEPHTDGVLIGRRIGVVYLGIAVLLFLARGAPHSELRTAVTLGVLTAVVLLAGLGIFEFRAGRAGPAILVSVALEIVLAAGFIWVLTSS